MIIYHSLSISPLGIGLPTLTTRRDKARYDPHTYTTIYLTHVVLLTRIYLRLSLYLS